MTTETENFFAQFASESTTPCMTAEQAAEVQRAEYEHQLRAFGYTREQFPHNRPENEDWSLA